MISKYVAEIEELLKEKGVGPPQAAEPRPITRRQWAVFIIVAGSIFALLALWASGMLLSMIARLLQ